MTHTPASAQPERHGKESLLVRAVRWYQRTISAARPPRCRYAPSCSAYAIQAIQIHGTGKGTLLTVWRLLRCNPLTKGGVDRVPPPGQWPSKPLDQDELLELYAKEDALDDTNNATGNPQREHPAA
ncbi:MULTISPECIES: membrane protein insertion efficiency factor YidD [Actinotignum]|uniref:membrane protein insertion efficiency factor YidD n=1 Tax=Actinotignum TaxID=1653174 RepID=UPI00254EE0CB|nr:MULTISPECIES: membrane protein insertion efficiency factor YidD [Actinotignum]MDE1535921.1 membrane protein insertion efficiency factor YidD [Actinotignum schaalii]MDK7271689.1 membrane protein insertion efficiency factor YidD [Actinotignum schaalii]MDY5144291.1 membrane protein insertion efficiency factor YidD [Actinotignum timonense]